MRKRDYIFLKDVVCSDSRECSNKIVAGLEFKTSLRLHANSDTQGDIEGSVSILHTQNNHNIFIILYMETLGRLKEVTNLPSKDQMNDILIEVLEEESRVPRPNRVIDFIRRLFP